MCGFCYQANTRQIENEFKGLPIIQINKIRILMAKNANIPRGIPYYPPSNRRRLTLPLCFFLYIAKSKIKQLKNSQTCSIPRCTRSPSPPAHNGRASGTRAVI